MSNFYLIYGNENYLVNKKLNEILEELSSNVNNTYTFDLSTSKIEDVLSLASTVNMFEDKKIVILNNSIFLTSEGKIDDGVNELTKYIANYFSDVYIIFVVNYEKLDERKKNNKISKKSK